MPTPEQMTAAVHAYVDAFAKADSEAAVALFAEDASVEDPVGTPPKVGTDAIREFYTYSMGTGAKLHLQGPIRVGENYAAFAFQVRLKMGEADATVDVIDVFRFEETGKVRKMEAYFGPANFGAA
ncbi:MAG: nuclear transport factor 2 family protein [Novosphingobium sp.]|nr:nuclear transport factor 2 family protein [Novosphingobium sp.]